MIEPYLTKNSAVSSANSTEVLRTLEGEEIEVTLLLPSREGFNYTIVFKSGCSFAFNSRGAYWINDQKTTHALIQSQIKEDKHAHDQYHALHKLLGIAL